MQLALQRALQRPNNLIGAFLHSPLGTALTAPHGPDRYLELIDPLQVRGENRARLEARQADTADCATLTLTPSRPLPPHAAGQHVQLGVTIDGVRHTRCFSIASAANRDDGRLQITVKSNDDGYVSRHLVRYAEVGEVITVSEPAGEFVLPEPRPEKLLLISGGSGITPVMAMLRTLCNEGHRGEVVFIHYARRYNEFTFRDELAEMERSHSNLRVVRCLTQDTPEGRDLAGHFELGHLVGVTPDLAAYRSFACGPEPLIKAVQTHWAEAGAADRLAVEYFQPPQRADGPAGGRVSFATSGVAADDAGASLLEAAESAGLTPEYGCRMGICHSCTCRKTQGTVRNLVTGRESGGGAEDIQPCVSVPVGDVTLNL